MTYATRDDVEALELAGEHLLRRLGSERPVFPNLRRRFPFSIDKACEATSLAHRVCVAREAFT